MPSIIGFKGVPDGYGNDIGYKMIPKTANRSMKNDDTKGYYGDFPAELCAGKFLISIYTNIIENQYVGDAKAPLLRLIDLKQRLKKFIVSELEPPHRIVFTKLDYKKNFRTPFNQYQLSYELKRGS